MFNEQYRGFDVEFESLVWSRGRSSDDDCLVLLTEETTAGGFLALSR